MQLKNVSPLLSKLCDSVVRVKNKIMFISDISAGFSTSLVQMAVPGRNVRVDLVFQYDYTIV